MRQRPVMVLIWALTGIAWCNAETPLSGVWTVWPNVNDNSLTEQTYSWGEGVSVRNGSIDIDLGAEEPWLRLGYLGGVFPVRSVERVGEEQFRIEFWFSRGGFAVVWLATFLDSDRVFFEQIEGELSITGIFGPENVHHRIDGPQCGDSPPVTPQ